MYQSHAMQKKEPKDWNWQANSEMDDVSDVEDYQDEKKKTGVERRLR
jgi:hypothetical protein